MQCWLWFQQYFSYIVAVSFIGGGNRSNKRKPPTCHKSLTNFITWCYIEYASPWARFGLWFLTPLSTIFQFWQSILFVEEIGVPGENHRPVTTRWQTLLHNVVSSTPHDERGSNSQLLVLIGTDCTGSCRFNYHTITTTHEGPFKSGNVT